MRLIKRPLVWIPAALLLALAALRLHYDPPVHEGNAAQFWAIACGIELPAYAGERSFRVRGPVFAPIEGMLLYGRPMQHEMPLYQVPLASVSREADAAAQLLKSPITASRDRICELDNTFCASHLHGKNILREACLADLPAAGGDSSALLSRLHYAEPGQAYARWKAGKLAWLNAAGEWAYLMACWMLAFAHRLWPARFPDGRLALAASPFALMLPAWLGYAPGLFTYGPAGAVIYDVVVQLLALPVILVPVTPPEIAFLDALPRVLADLSIDHGPAMAWSYMGYVGPLACLVYGAALAGIATLWRALTRWRRNRRQRAAAPAA